MSTSEKIQTALEEAEQKLQSLASIYLIEGDYDRLDRVLSIIKYLKQVDRLSEASPQAAPDILKSKRRSQLKEKKVQNIQKSKREYPFFTRVAESLNRVGWSKKRKKEYNQKIPYEIVERTAVVLPEFCSLNNPFKVPDLTEEISKKSKIRVKNYQIYTVVAWFKSLGLIKHLGDDGYLLSSDNLLDRIQEEWMQLPS